MQNSAKLGLAYVAPQQSQKHVTVNEAFRRLDMLVQASVKSRNVAAEPAAPADGDAYILPAGRTGAAWSLMSAGAVAAFQDGAWTEYSPREGWRVWVDDENLARSFDGADWVADSGGGGRELLTADRTYYVRTDGADGNTGLANTAGGAFLTIQKAIDVAASLDLGVYNVTIKVADGTYSTSQTLKTYVGAGVITIEGNTTTPANVLINPAGNGFAGTFYGAYTLRGFKLACGGLGITIAGGVAKYEALDFGACSIHVMAKGPTQITAIGNYSITGAASRHWLASTPGAAIIAAGVTVTITGTPAFSAAFAQAEELAGVRPTSMTFTGSATGPRYRADSLGLIQTNGAGATYLPGNSAGSTSAGGQYA